MDLDIEGLTHVIHVDMPHTVEQYVHRSGRTGRAGADGEVLSLLTPAEERDYRKLTRGIRPVEKIWRNGRLQEVSSIPRRPTNEENKKVVDEIRCTGLIGNSFW